METKRSLLSAAAAALGKKGGQVRSKNKSRGNAEYYKALALKSAAKRRAKKEIKETSRMKTYKGFRWIDGTVDNTKCPHLHWIDEEGTLRCQTCGRPLAADGKERQ